MSTQNPTLAVALHYDKKGAPRVVAKGMHLIAGRIRARLDVHRGTLA